jgi:hypothetical protein
MDGNCHKWEECYGWEEGESRNEKTIFYPKEMQKSEKTIRQMDFYRCTPASVARDRGTV